MSYVNPARIGYADTPALDAFGRLRVSDLDTLFASSAEYELQTTAYWDTVLVGTGAVTTLPNESAVQLSTGGTGSGASAVYQTRQYFRYQPGKSQRVLMTFVFGSAVANVRRRIGYFDANNGLFLEQTSTAVSVVRRTFTSGAAVDNAVAQTSWSIDKMDGTGPSGITIDWTKTQILAIDFQWLGVGRVRIGLVVNGVTYYVHEFLNANSLTVPFMTTPHLPMRVEITNTAAAAGTNTFKFICSSVDSEGGFSEGISLPMAAIRTNTASCGTGGTTVIAVRPKTTYGGKTNRGVFIPKTFEILAGSGEGLWVCYYGDTAGVTGGSWASASPDSLVEMNLSPTGSFSSTIPVSLAYVSGGGVNARALDSHVLEHRLPGCLGANGTTQWGFAIVGYSFSGTINVAAGLTWDEFR